MRLPGGGRAFELQGLHRGVAGAAQTLPDGRLFVEVDEQPDDVPVDGKTRNLEREYRAVVEEILELRGDDGRDRRLPALDLRAGHAGRHRGYSPDLNYDQKVKLLQTLDVTERLELALGYQRERLAELQVRKRIREDVESGAEKQQREYFLRKQMESIRKELDEDDASVVEEYRTKIEEAGMPEHAREQAEKELGRLEKMGEQSAESSVIRTYLDWLIAVPWSENSEEKLDPVHARDGPRRGPRRPGGRQGPDRRVHRGQEAARRSWDHRGQALRRHPHPDRTARHRQDLASASRSPVPPAASSCACRWAASVTRPRSAATGGRTSARCRDGWSVPCATPGR